MPAPTCACGKCPKCRRRAAQAALRKRGYAFGPRGVANFLDVQRYSALEYIWRVLGGPGNVRSTLGRFNSRRSGHARY